jgi:endonuclease/exonuclease/phosphatase family metal-dependent hydrolase
MKSALRKYFFHCVFFCSSLVCFNFLFADTLTIATYNILNFPDAIGMQRIDDFRIVIDYINPDIIAVQELQSQTGLELFLDSVMNYQGNEFEAIDFNDGPDTDNGLFYCKNKVEFLSAQYLSMPIRDIAQYKLRFKNSLQEFYIFSVHFKASQGYENELIRLQEATILRNHLDTLEIVGNFLVMGDLNIYYSDEPAYHRLTDSLVNNNGRLFDPLDASGYWHENSNFAYLHSQSTRTEELPDGGATGGLDDRFDMILCSQSFLDTAGLFLLADSYTACGNDGNHFNRSINYGYNSAVPDSVADALSYGSDHLPVFISLTDEMQQGVVEEVVEIWPNPMETEAQIRFPWFDDFEMADITITNILGQRVYKAETYDPIGIDIDRGRLPMGIYFVHIKIKTKYNDYNYHSKFAIVK